MRMIKLVGASLVALALLCAWPAGALAGEGVNYISIDELADILKDSWVTVLDVRTGKDWDDSRGMIWSAQREDPKAVEDWAEQYGKYIKLVLY